MNPLLSLAFSRVGLYVMSALAAFAFLFWIVAGIRDNAVQDERARVEQANRAIQDAADEAQRDVLTCIGNWNRDTGKCER